MKQISGWMLAAISVLLMSTAADRTWAQGSTMSYGDKKVAIRRLPRISAAKQYTPQFSSTTPMPATVNRPREWALFDVAYYLLAERTSEGRKEYSFYKTTVHYLDVARGEHRGCVALPPTALLRNGDRFIAMAVEFSAADNTPLAVGTITTGSGSSLPPDWWKNPKITEDKSVFKRDGLVDRSKTPFGLINIDDYEVVK